MTIIDKVEKIPRHNAINVRLGRPFLRLECTKGFVSGGAAFLPVAKDKMTKEATTKRT